MPESLFAVDEDDRNFITEAFFQLRVAINVDLFENELLCESFAQDYALRLVAKVAAGACVDDDVRFFAQFMLRSIPLVLKPNPESNAGVATKLYLARAK